jgi:hypothetical protein
LHGEESAAPVFKHTNQEFSPEDKEYGHNTQEISLFSNEKSNLELSKMKKPSYGEMPKYTKSKITPNPHHSNP